MEKLFTLEYTYPLNYGKTISEKIINFSKVINIIKDEHKRVINDIVKDIAEVAQDVQNLCKQIEIGIQNTCPISFEEEGLTKTFNSAYRRWLELLFVTSDIVEQFKLVLVIVETKHTEFQNAFSRKLKPLNAAITAYGVAVDSVAINFDDTLREYRPNYNLFQNAKLKLVAIATVLTGVNEVVSLFIENRAEWANALIISAQPASNAILKHRTGKSTLTRARASSL